MWVAIQISRGYDGGNYLAPAYCPDYTEDGAELVYFKDKVFHTEEECRTFINNHNTREQKKLWG